MIYVEVGQQQKNYKIVINLINMKASPLQINQHFTNHKTALKNVKPVVSSIRKSQQKLQKNNKKQIINYNEFDLVYKMFKSVNNQKVSIDNKVPICDKAKKFFKDKHKQNRYQKLAVIQHQRQLKSVKQRIDNCGSLQQRKKRNYDPIVNPTYFMRQKQQGGKSITIIPFAKNILKQNEPKVIRPASAKKLQRPIQNQYGMAPTINNLYTKQFEQKNKIKQRPKSSIPNASLDKTKGQSQTQFPEATFKSIINYVVDRKLFKDLDLRVLYQRLCYRYGQQNIEEIWERVLQQIQK